MIEKDDIVERKFDNSLFGYDKVEVKYFQKMIAEEFDKLQARIKELEEIKSKYVDIKGQKAEDIVRNGKEKAEEIITNAEQKADRILSDMEEKRQRIINSINELEVKKTELIDSIREILNKQKELIELYHENDK